MSREAWSKGWRDGAYHEIEPQSNCSHYQAGYKHGVWQKECLIEENKKIDEFNKDKKPKYHKKHYAIKI